MHLAKTRWQAKSRLMLRMLLLVKTAGSRPALLELQAQAKLLVQQPAIPLAQVRARQCLRGPDPFAFFREIPVAQKCNRAACYGECPIFSRYRRRCSRRELVEYGNRRSRLLRKRAPPV
jgi:hypothetical protein